MNSTLNFGIPPVLVFQLDDCYKVDRLLTGINAQQKGTTARWYSNKTSLLKNDPTIYNFTSKIALLQPNPSIVEFEFKPRAYSK